jgi:iron complex transport system substrate-binding protein
MRVRIVSLVPNATEIVCALGLTDALVGISHDCDYPPEIRGKPTLSQAVVDADARSAAIDSQIREAVHSGTSVYHLDAEALSRLNPDLILTQELCAVCAPSYTLVTRAAKLLDSDVKIVSLEPHRLHDVLDNIRLVGELTGTATRANALVEGLAARIAAVGARHARPTRDVPAPRPRVVCLEWMDPIYVGGHWVPEMVDAAGGLDVLGRTGEASRVVGWDEVMAAQPEMLVLMPCGYDIARTRAELETLTARPGWRRLPAVQAGRVFLTDASSYFNRPGPRLVDGLEMLASVIHPAMLESEMLEHTLPPGALERM